MTARSMAMKASMCWSSLAPEGNSEAKWCAKIEIEGKLRKTKGREGKGRNGSMRQSTDRGTCQLIWRKQIIKGARLELVLILIGGGSRGVEREENLLVSVLFFGGDGVSFPFYFNLEQHSPFPTVQNNYTMALPTFTDFPINRWRRKVHTKPDRMSHHLVLQTPQEFIH